MRMFWCLYKTTLSKKKCQSEIILELAEFINFIKFIRDQSKPKLAQRLIPLSQHFLNIIRAKNSLYFIHIYIRQISSKSTNQYLTRRCFNLLLKHKNTLLLYSAFYQKCFIIL